jgi:hypothetical protein
LAQPQCSHSVVARLNAAVERVVVGRRAVTLVDAQDLAVQAVERLRGGGVGVVADADVLFGFSRQFLEVDFSEVRGKGTSGAVL